MSVKKSFLIDDILDQTGPKFPDNQENIFYIDQVQRVDYDRQIQKFYNQRSPRIQFSLEQLFVLENRFNQCQYLNKNDVKYLSFVLNLSDKRVIYF